MQICDDDTFHRFAAARKKDLKRIARATRGEHAVSDVVAEAWLMARRFKPVGGNPFDLSEPAQQERLLSHLYQHLVRYAEQNVRHAVRLDHAPGHADNDGATHPLLNILASDDGLDPLATLIEGGNASTQTVEPDAHHSQAGAYLHLLRRFDNRMRSVANYLLISLSYSYRRCSSARRMAIAQHPLPLRSSDTAFIPRTWRRFRAQRACVQLAFRFDEELPFPHQLEGAAEPSSGSRS